MIKEVHFFTEMGYSAYDQKAAARYGYTSLLFPNEYFSPEKAQELYSMYFEELQYCTEAGYDGVMINEHHNNPLEHDALGQRNRLDPSQDHQEGEDRLLGQRPPHPREPSAHR